MMVVYNKNAKKYTWYISRDSKKEIVGRDISGATSLATMFTSGWLVQG
jgi:hypothetical protein